MEIIYHIAFGIHMLCVLAILALLILQINKNPKKLNPGVVHATLTAFVAALIMVGLWDQAYDEEINHMKIGVKTLVLGVILVLGYKNFKKIQSRTLSGQPCWASQSLMCCWHTSGN